MALYQTTYTYTIIDTPLSEPQFTSFDYTAEFPDPVIHVHRRMVRIMVVVVLVVIALLVWGAMALTRDTERREEAVAVPEDAGINLAAEDTAVAATGDLSPVFSREVQHWKPQILAWSAAHNLDPNITATIMQIESCGDPQALSHAGAHGLFQVMPFHFESHEDMFDPDTNAFRGLSFLTYVLDLTDGDVGLALAGYNGGPAAALSSWADWVPETQRYYTWGTGIYEEAGAGLSESPTLQAWMDAGGRSLCNQASSRLGLQ